MRIWKYELSLTDINTVDMPLGAKILSARVQKGTICVWALVNSQAPIVPREIYIYGTGDTIPTNPGEFIDTVQLHYGAGREFVGHIFAQPAHAELAAVKENNE